MLPFARSTHSSRLSESGYMSQLNTCERSIESKMNSLHSSSTAVINYQHNYFISPTPEIISLFGLKEVLT